jgi:hypothetical protein
LRKYFDALPVRVSFWAGQLQLMYYADPFYAIESSGGLTDTAKHSQVLLFRRVSSDWYEVKKVNVKRLMQAMDLNEDLHLQPGDLLFVPTSTVAKIKRFIPSSGMGVYYNPYR